jgi:aerobic-type carbon monoxide dehydrogenase small subunit (CoxS/CutS family)
LLSDHPDAGEQEIREALSGNICRCTGYQSIIDGVLLAAQRNRALRNRTLRNRTLRNRER